MQLHSSCSLLKNSLCFKKLRFGVLSGLRLKEMGSEMRSSKLTMAASGSKKDEELIKISADCNEKSEKSVIKECAVESVEVEEIRRNLGKLESMTVKELRAISRSVGLSTRGTKKDLISSLKCLSFEGKTVISEGMEMAPLASENQALKSNVENLDHELIAEVLENKQRGTKRRKQMVVTTTTEDDSKCVLERNELPIDTEEVIGTRKSPSQKQVFSTGQSNQKVSTQISLGADTHEPWTVLAHKKPQKEWIPYNPRTLRPPPLNEDTNSMKLVSWNVNGLRALLKLESFPALQLAQHEDFDVLCLQETKLQEKDVDVITKNLIDGYDSSYWSCSVSKLGYSGAAIISRHGSLAFM